MIMGMKSSLPAKFERMVEGAILPSASVRAGTLPMS